MREIHQAGGIPVIFEHVNSLPGLFTISIFFDTGSANETAENNGVSHFIEHMAFRGTRDFSSEEISRLSEMYGGYLNAYTSKEVTAYYIKGFSGNLELFVRLMANICFHPTFDKDDFEQEKQIIVDEINSVNDDPDEYLGEKAEIELFKGCSLEYPVSGTVESVRALRLSELKRYYAEHYVAGNCIISVSGDVNSAEVISLFKKYLPAARESLVGRTKRYNPVYNTFSKDYKFKSGQSYVQLMYPAFAYGDARRYRLTGASMLLGGLMSSRLFQEIRERRGLCYNIETEAVLYKDAGYVNIMYSCSEKNSDQVRDLTLKEIRSLIKNGITDDEMLTVINQLKFSYVANFETLESRAQMNFRHMYHYGRLLESGDIMAEIDSITKKDIHDIAENVLSKEYSVCRLVQ